MGEAYLAANEALRANPRDAEACYVLGMCAYRQGVLDQAARLFQRAGELEPGEPRHPALEAACLLNSGKSDEAHRAADRALSLRPTDASTFDTIGIVYMRTNDLQKAASAFERAAAINPQEPRYLAFEATCQVMAGKFVEARRAADKAVALGPRDPDTLETLGVVYTRMAVYQPAVELLNKAVAMRPNALGTLYNLAYSQQYIGDLEAAEATFRRILKIDPAAETAWLALVELKRQTPEDNSVSRLEEVFRAVEADPERRLLIGHALAKSCEDLGRYDEAFGWLARGKAGRRELQKLTIDQMAEAFEAAAETFDGIGEPDAGFASEEPIFIVGMPRSGTTLVERILGSHPDVTSAEELQTFPYLVKQASGVLTPSIWDAETFKAARRINLRRLGAEYVRSTRPLTGRTPRFTDKLPFNFLYAGLIHRALPQARIVCLRRDALDTALNNYRQMFATSSPWHGYVYDPEDVARFVVLFDRLIAHWRKALPSESFMEIGYEDLVADQEGQTRRLLDFCGLGWDPRCLAFHESAKGVSTASAAQVRKPLHAQSVGRAKRWGERVEPMRAVLHEANLCE